MLDEENTLDDLRRIAEQFGERQSDDVRPLSGGRRRSDPPEMVELRSDMEDVKGTLKAIVEHLKYSRMPALPDTLQKAYTRLVQHDVDEHLAADIIQSVLARANQDQMSNKQYLEQQLLAAIAGIIPTAGTGESTAEEDARHRARGSDRRRQDHHHCQTRGDQQAGDRPGRWTDLRRYLPDRRD